MAYKVIKYRLTEEGAIPTFLKFGAIQVTGGIHPVKDNSTASPRDTIYLGIADDGADISGSEGEIASKDALITYLTDMNNAMKWKQIASDGTTEEDFVPATHATKIWDDLTTLNGG
jgi:hypothetical protein